MELIGIIRVSTAEQAEEQRAGIARQKTSIQAIANRMGVPSAGLTLITVSDVSGSDLGLTREWQEQVIPRLASPSTHLAVDAIDRLARPDKFDFQVMAAIQATETLIYTPEGEVNLARPDGYMLGGLRALFGAFEKMELKRRLQGGKEAKRRRGEHPNGDHLLPRGIGYDKATGAWGYTDEAWIPQLAYRLLVDEGLENLSELARRCGGVHLTGIQCILRNPIYKGWKVYSKKRGHESYGTQLPGRQPRKKQVRRAPDEVIKVQVYGLPGQAPPLVSEDVWEQAQVILNRLKASARKRRLVKQENPYSGFLVSDREIVAPGEEPRHVLYAIGRGKRTWVNHYYCRCHDKGHAISSEPCELPFLATGEVNKGVDEVITRVTSGKLFVEQVLRVVKADRGDRTQDATRLKRELARLEKEESRLVRLHLKGRISETVYDKEYEVIRGQVQALQAVLGQVESQGATPLDEKALTAHLEALSFDSGWDCETKRAWLSKHVRYIKVGKEGVSLILFRLPPPVGDYGYLDTWSWVELVGFQITDRKARLKARLKAKGLYLSPEVGARLGIHKDTVSWHIRQGNLQAPKGKEGPWMVWTEEEVVAIEEAYKAFKAKGRKSTKKAS